MTNDIRYCPALFLSAPASRQGKTTLTAGLARYHRDQGRKVRVFKTGPDFLDPYILEQASGQPVHSLDLWMTGEAECRRLLHQAAGEADLILIEGSMGLFDGTPSSADLAQTFGVPVAVLIDASSMAQTFAAIAHGLATFRPNLPFYGVLANRVASARHEAMLRETLPAAIRWLGAIPRKERMALPERHLGLVQAQEVDDLEQKIAQAATYFEGTVLAELPPALTFHPVETEPVPRLLDGIRIAIAQDKAFSFLYPANLELLKQMGAELSFFSPLAESTLPEADAVYLPGGYPELHLDVLAANHGLRQALRAHVDANKPLYAECGGMLYLLETLTDGEGKQAEMLDLLSGHARLHDKVAGLGLQWVELSGGVLRGHTFHYSSLATSQKPWTRAVKAVGGGAGESIYRQGSIIASYLHLYFPSNPQATAALFMR